MKSLVVYYSFEGNCDLIATLIQEEIGADLLRLKPIKDLKSKGFTKYMWGGKQALMKQKPELEKTDLVLEEYELIIIGTPVWAWNFSPAINTFLTENEIKNKKILLFCCHGGGPGKTLQKMRDRLEGNDLLGEADFFEPLGKDKTEVIEKVRTLCEHIKMR